MARDQEAWDRVLADRRRRFMQARADLAETVKAACPGPHALVQHRDRLPAWCHACGRDAIGNRQRDVG